MMNSAHEEWRPKVLLALDGSPAAATALPLARTMADQLGAIVEIFHVATSARPGADLWQRLHVDLRDGEEVQVRSHVGDPSKAILEAARAHAVELVVLTTHGRIVEPGRSLGRVAQHVVAHTQRPVLLVRPEAISGGLLAPLQRLLLPLDGTPTTASALRPAMELACRLGAAIDLLYVVSPDQPAPDEPGSIGVPRYIDQPHHEWPAWADRVIDHLCVCLGGRPPDLAIQVFLVVGDIASEISKFATEHHSDAIVLVRRSHLEVGRARVLRAVLDQTPCPVLLVGAG
jgi:nucleotide-binding universal stress UspA family protein